MQGLNLTFLRSLLFHSAPYEAVTFIFFKIWANPGLFFVYFRSFQANNAIFTKNQCKKSPSKIQRWDLNPQPLKHESPH